MQQNNQMFEMVYDDDHAEKKSSNIQRIEYCEKDGILDVHFKGDRSYRYFDVPRATVDNLVRAHSVGGFIYSSVKDIFKFEEI